MSRGPNTDTPGGVPTVSVPDIRDYQKINAELRRLLDQGHKVVELVGVNRQRLLVSGLAGNWRGVVVLVGNPGPEFAAELNAPNLRIDVMGSVADGLCRGMKAGRVVVAGSAGDGTAYTMQGGSVLIEGSTGHRTGLMFRGGTLIVRGTVGRLAGERQSGGSIYLASPRIAENPGKGAWGGRLYRAGIDLPIDEYRAALREFDYDDNDNPGTATS